MTFNASGLKYDDVAVGDELPPLEVPLTRTLIVATAIASRDYQDVHHDPGLAQERGSPDIFMNILSTNGFVGRFVTDWAGPRAVLQKVDIRLGVPNYPGDTMRLTGTVAEKRDGAIDVAVVGANSLGNHVTGTVSLVLRNPPSDERPSEDGYEHSQLLYEFGATPKKSKKSNQSKKNKKNKKNKDREREPDGAEHL